MEIALIMACLVMLVLGGLLAGILGVAKDKLHVDQDPRIDEICEVLPAANCGGCGLAGCSDFAKAVVEGRAKPDGCPVGGADCAAAVGKIMGMEVGAGAPNRPILKCSACNDQRLGIAPYEGVRNCTEAALLGVTQACSYGCLGFGECVEACGFGAMRMENGSPTFDYEKCVGCGACAEVCPRDLIELAPFTHEGTLAIRCANKEPGKEVKKVCNIGCIGCKLCQKLCPEVFGVEDNIAFVKYDTYTGQEDISKVVEKCKAKVIRYFGKEPIKETLPGSDVAQGDNPADDKSEA